MYARRGITLCLLLGISLAGCGAPPPKKPADAGNSKPAEYEVLDTKTDNFDFSAAKAQAEEAIAKYPDLGCMVGLFAYNPPAILEALKGADKLGKIKLVGFDEQDETLQAIVDGHCYGTVVQNPYRYGYESVRILAGLARGDKSVLPEGGFLNIPARKITKDNVQEFWAELKKLTAESPASDTEKPDLTDEPTVAFVTNGIASFWLIAEKGARAAGRDFNVNVEVRMPTADGAVANQQRMMEELVTLGVDGIAVSPIDGANQVGFLNSIAEKTNLITHDADAPDANRLCYVGMDNMLAGVMCGELVREAMPEGGSVMLFVGRLEQDNARQRNDGTIQGIKQPGDEASADPADGAGKEGDTAADAGEVAPEDSASTDS